MKFDFLGLIGTTRNLENHYQNHHRVICLSAIGLRVKPYREILSNFATFTAITKMPLTFSNMDGFWILKILLIATI